MKKQLIFAAILITFMAIPAYAGVNIGINVGIPAPLPSSVVIQTAPEFIYSPQLGFHVSVGSPHDIVYIGNDYYLYNNGYYYRSHNYNGPWVGVEGRRLPPGLRKHRYEEVRRYRDREYRKYNHDRKHYNGRWYRPGEVARNEHRGSEYRGGEDQGGKHHGGGGHGGGGRH